MKRILQMPVRDAKGGITQYVMRNWALIDKSKLMFDWVTLDKELSFEQDLIKQGCRVYKLSCRQEDDEERFRSEMLKIFQNGYNTIHLHTSFWRGFLAEKLAVEAGMQKIIVHAHSTGIDNSDEKKRLELFKIHEEWKRKFNTGFATHFAACSENAAEFLFGEQIPKERITILRNGIDTRKFEFREVVRANTRKALGAEENFVLLQSGRLEYQKNYEFTLTVFAEYAKLNPNAVLLIVGKGSLENKLKKQAASLGNKVRFLGFRPDIPELLMAADVFLQPSHFEGFSIASIEAQCSGIPWLVSESVPEEALALRSVELPLYKAALPLHKATWVDMLVRIAECPDKNIDAGEQLRALGWDILDSAKILEQLYLEEDKPL